MGQITEVERSLAATLFDTTKHLERYIADRAAAIAEPRIAETEQHCTDMVDALMATQESERLRWESLRAEFGRQIRVQENAVARLRNLLLTNGISPVTGLSREVPTS